MIIASFNVYRAVDAQAVNAGTLRANTSPELSAAIAAKKEELDHDDLFIGNIRITEVSQ